MSQYWNKSNGGHFNQKMGFSSTDTHCIRKLFLICVWHQYMIIGTFLFEVKSNNNEPNEPILNKSNGGHFTKKMGFSSTEIHII